MADSVMFQAANPATPPAGFVVATDEVDGQHYQRVKIDLGADGAAEPVIGALPVSGTVTAVQGTAANLKALAEITDGLNIAGVQVGDVTGLKGLRVFVQGSDPVSDLSVFVEYNHHQNHEGEAYQYTYPLTAIGNGVTVYFRLVVPTYAVTIRAPHLWFEVDVLAQTTISLYESPNVTGGNLQTTYCRNRNSANTPGMTVYLAPTVNSTGTLLSQHTVGDATAGTAMAVFDEWILKSNTTYLIGVLAGSTGDSFGLRLKWYEDLGV